MPGKKKSPTSPTWQRNDVEPATEAPKGGSVSSLLPSVESEGCQGCQGSQEFHAGNLAPFDSAKTAKTAKTAGKSALGKLAAFDFEGRSVALVSPRFLRGFLEARGGVLAPGGPSLETTAAGLLLAPSTALYVVDGEERPLADELLEIPALTRLGGASRAASEAA